MSNAHQPFYLKCPFCLDHSLEAKPGKTTCPECSAEFEIDDRLECIFADTNKMRPPVNGMVCGVCGLVQGDQVEKCLYCAVELRTTFQ
jgi:hypothetical protein